MDGINDSTVLKFNVDGNFQKNIQLPNKVRKKNLISCHLC